MPRGDGTGPWGQGPMTGRGLGYCSGYERSGFMTPRPGMGLGRGMGAGWTPGRGMGMGMGMGRGRFAGFQGYPYPQMMPYGTPPPYAYPQNFPQSYPQDQAQNSQETSRKQSEKKQK